MSKRASESRRKVDDDEVRDAAENELICLGIDDTHEVEEKKWNGKIMMMTPQKLSSSLEGSGSENFYVTQKEPHENLFFLFRLKLMDFFMVLGVKNWVRVLLSFLW
jgi:hypothetical protein